MGGAFAGLQEVGFARIEAKAAQPVVHDHAGVAPDHARAEWRKNTLDERDRVSVPIRSAQKSGVAAQRNIRGGLHLSRLTDDVTAFGGVLFGDQHGDFRIPEVGIFEVTNPIFEGELFCSHLAINDIRAIHLAIMQWPGFDNVEHLENHESLRHRRLLVNQIISVIGAKRLQPLRDGFAEVFFGKQSPFGLERLAYFLRHFAGVKTIPSLSCDTLQYSAESSLIEKLAGAQSLQRLAIDAIDPGKFRTELFDSFSQFLMDGKSFPRKPNRIGRKPTQLLGSIALVQFEPAVDRPGHRNA